MGVPFVVPAICVAVQQVTDQYRFIIRSDNPDHH